MKNEQIFIELIDSLENDKDLFLSGILHSEIEFLDNIHRLQKFAPYIQNENIKQQINKFINSIISSKNYSIVQKTIEQDRIREKQRELAKQKMQEERQNAILKKQAIIQAQKRKEETILKIISSIDASITNKDLKRALALYYKFYNDIAIYHWDYLIKNEQKMKIADCINRKNIKKLIHFTNLKNLKNILALGIIPRKELIEKHIQFEHTDKTRCDGRTDCTCFSIEYPNFKMLHYKKSQTNDKYVILVIDAISVLLNNLKKYYVYINAANSNAAWWLENDTLSQVRYLENMFLPKVSDKNTTYEREEKDPSFIPTNPQAEILINGIVETKDIIEVHFENSDDYKNFKDTCNDQTILNNFKIEVNDFYFKDDRENVIWEDR